MQLMENGEEKRKKSGHYCENRMFVLPIILTGERNSFIKFCRVYDDMPAVF